MKNDKYLIVVSGPAGTGKDTVVNRLRQKHPEIGISISATTRAPRGTEQEGVDYFYLSNPQFEEWIRDDKLVEYTNYCGNYYGTPRAQIEERISKGIYVVLVIEVEGAANIKRQYPDSTTIFICPPSMEELENRLRGRGTDTPESIQKRLSRAKEEIKLASTYDEQVVNDDVDRCADEIYALITAKKLTESMPEGEWRNAIFCTGCSGQRHDPF